MIEQLGDLLRLSLEHADEQEVPLERELMFVDRYIQLQLARFADRLDVQMRVERRRARPPPCRRSCCSRWSRTPSATASRNSRPRGIIELSAWRDGRSLRVRVRDNGPGLPPGWTLDQHVGIGLGNTRARLEQLYGKGAYSLEVDVGQPKRGTCVGRHDSLSRRE